MNLIRSITLLLLMIAVTTLNVSAQEDPEVKAGNILKELSERYQGYDIIKADFRYVMETREEDDDFRDERSGTIIMKGDKFRLNLGDQEVITDNETVWRHIKDAKEVQINHYNPGEFEFHPSDIFHIYAEDYRYIHVGTDVQDGNVFEVIELNPHDRDDDIFKIRLYIERGSGQIKKSKMFEKTGLIYTYHIESMDTNIDESKDYFTFNPDDHPDVTEIDLR